MEIKGDRMAISVDELNIARLYAGDVDDPSVTQRVYGFEDRLQSLGIDETDPAIDPRMPIIDMPYSQADLDVVTHALSHRLSRDEQLVQESDAEAERSEKIQRMLSRRKGFIDGTIVRFNSRRGPQED
jgi:hypothetical protein